MAELLLSKDCLVKYVCDWDLRHAATAAPVRQPYIGSDPSAVTNSYKHRTVHSAVTHSYTAMRRDVFSDGHLAKAAAVIG